MAVLAVATMGCAQIPDPVKRKDQADGFATQNNWVAKLVHTDSFAIQTYVPKETEHNRRLVIYFEGDGLAWLSSTRPSSDPSPLDPVGLQMAMAHTGQQARAYVARPCQYVLDPLCRQKHWTGHRFSKEVIDSTAQVVDERKRRTGASRLVLVGYSGGAAIAALLAAQRHDVDVLVTVAGNLDTDAWVRHHGLSPLAGSMNPTEHASQLKGVVQFHFVGGQDKVVPASLVKNFASAGSDSRLVHISNQTDFDHVCCWAQNWPKLWSQVEFTLTKKTDQ